MKRPDTHEEQATAELECGWHPDVVSRMSTQPWKIHGQPMPWFDIKSRSIRDPEPWTRERDSARGLWELNNEHRIKLASIPENERWACAVVRLLEEHMRLLSIAEARMQREDRGEPLSIDALTKAPNLNFGQQAIDLRCIAQDARKAWVEHSRRGIVKDLYNSALLADWISIGWITHPPTWLEDWIREAAGQ